MEISESGFVDESGSRIPLESLAARQIRPGEEPPRGLFKVWGEPGNLESEPSDQWKRSQAFLRALALIYAAKNKLSKSQSAQLIKDVDDLRPESPLPVFEESLGTPEEFLEAWRGHELDVSFKFKKRNTQVFEIRHESIPPDEPEDLDEAGEPKGHWEGLVWIPDPSGNNDR